VYNVAVPVTSYRLQVAGIIPLGASPLILERLLDIESHFIRFYEVFSTRRFSHVTCNL